MLDREQLETFATIIEQGTFERAATTLNVTRGAVSQRIKALEECLSAVLLVRDKPVIPTQSGEVLLRYVKALRLFEDAALAELVPGRSPRCPVPLAIAVNADSLATWVPKLLWPVLLKRSIALEVVADDQDHTVTRLARGEVIGCISTESKPAVGFVADALGEMEYRCYATPEFAAKYFAEGFSVAAVISAPAILFNRKDSLHDEFLESVFRFRIERYVKHYLPSPNALLEAVRAGVGYGLVPSVQARAAIDSGALIDLMPASAVFVKLYWHHWVAEPPQAKEITELIVTQGRRVLCELSKGADSSGLTPGAIESSESCE